MARNDPSNLGAIAANTSCVAGAAKALHHQVTSQPRPLSPRPSTTSRFGQGLIQPAVVYGMGKEFECSVIGELNPPRAVILDSTAAGVRAMDVCRYETGPSPWRVNTRNPLPCTAQAAHLCF